MVYVPRSVFLLLVKFYESKTGRKFNGQFMIRNVTTLQSTTMGDCLSWTYNSLNGEQMHRVRINKVYESSIDTVDTVFHEITHALQAELNGLEAFEKLYDEQSTRVGYWNNLYEVDARESADLLLKLFLKDYLPTQFSDGRIAILNLKNNCMNVL